jgi:putative membrane protein
MPPLLDNALTALPIFAAHLALAIVIFAAGLAIYSLVTPVHEFRLVRAGNAAAGVALAGVTVGLGIAVAAAMAASFTLFDIAIWGSIAVIVQIAAFVAVDLVMKGLSARVEAGETAAAAFLAAVQVSVGAINAAALL